MRQPQLSNRCPGHVDAWRIVVNEINVMGSRWGASSFSRSPGRGIAIRQTALCLAQRGGLDCH